MTQNTDPSVGASPPAPSAPVPVQVIGYAGIGTEYVVPSGVKVLLGFLSASHLLIGLPLMLWPVFVTVRFLSQGNFYPSHLVNVSLGVAAGAPNVWCGIAMLVNRRRGTWKAIHAVLAVLCGLELLAFIGGGVMVVTYKHAQGWDGLALALGLILAVGASIPFWLHAATKLLLLRVRVRRAFLFEHGEPVKLQRMGTIAMMSLYGIALLACGVAYLIR